MSLVTSQGIVLRRVCHLEEDLRLTLFLRDYGRILAVAKGGQRLKSKLKGMQEPFSEVEFQVFLPANGFHARLIGGKLVSSHHRLRESIEAFEVAAKCSEAVDTLLPFRATSPDVYDILRHSYQALQTIAVSAVKEASYVVWMVFVVRLLRRLGHGDFSSELLDALTDSERTRVTPLLMTDLSPIVAEGIRMSPPSAARGQRLVEARLEEILPWPLKSEVFS